MRRERLSPHTQSGHGAQEHCSPQARHQGGWRIKADTKVQAFGSNDHIYTFRLPRRVYLLHTEYTSTSSVKSLILKYNFEALVHQYLNVLLLCTCTRVTPLHSFNTFSYFTDVDE